ncbi:MAG: MCE family protein [Planctomycetes bacterium]|nr:MCE family protein [Planctomycetota bacterium]
MNDHKHVIVGLFVLVGAVLLGTMIAWFEGVAVFIRGGYAMHVHLDSAVGIRAGKRIHLDGIEVGDVVGVTSAEPQAHGVWVEVRISPDVRIPKSARFVAQQSALGGDPFLDFRTATATADFWPQDGSARVEGVILAPSILPEDIVTNFSELIAPRTPEEVGPDKPANLSSALVQIQRTAKAIQDEFQQPESQYRQLLARAGQSAEELSKTLKTVQDAIQKPDSPLNLMLGDARQSTKDVSVTLKGVDEMLATVRTTAETYTKAGVSLRETSEEARKTLAVISKDAEEVGVLAANVNSLVQDIQKGKGTFGQLVANDELHRQLVVLVENLQKMIDNTNRLVTMLREEGIFAKEGK